MKREKNGLRDVPIDPSKVTDLSVLKKGVVNAILFAALDKDRQREMYLYCRRNCIHPVCKKNLDQIRYAITTEYFGEFSEGEE